MHVFSHIYSVSMGVAIMNGQIVYVFADAC